MNKVSDAKVTQTPVSFRHNIPVQKDRYGNVIEGKGGSPVRLVPWATAAGSGLLSHSIAESVIDQILGEKKDDSLWRKVIRALIPLGIGGAGAYAGYRLGDMMSKESQDASGNNVGNNAVPTQMAMVRKINDVPQSTYPPTMKDEAEDAFNRSKTWSTGGDFVTLRDVLPQQKLFDYVYSAGTGFAGLVGDIYSLQELIRGGMALERADLKQPLYTPQAVEESKNILDRLAKGDYITDKQHQWIQKEMDDLGDSLLSGKLESSEVAKINERLKAIDDLIHAHPDNTKSIIDAQTDAEAGNKLIAGDKQAIKKLQKLKEETAGLQARGSKGITPEDQKRIYDRMKELSGELAKGKMPEKAVIDNARAVMANPNAMNPKRNWKAWAFGPANRIARGRFWRGGVAALPSALFTLLGFNRLNAAHRAENMLQELDRWDDAWRRNGGRNAAGELIPNSKGEWYENPPAQGAN